MKARTSARELVLLTFPQLLKNIEEIEDKTVEDIILFSVRTIAGESENELKLAVDKLLEIKEYIENYEIEHEDNLNKPIGSVVRPVELPLTSDMKEKIDCLIEVADKTLFALDISETFVLANKQDVKDYCVRLIRTFSENQTAVDDKINNYSDGWNINRMVRIDRDILRIAITELLFFKDIPSSVTIDEAVELAQKYGTDESYSFINGILRQVFEENNQTV